MKITTRRGVNYAIRRFNRGVLLDSGNRAVWFQCWRPTFHEGRGYYLSVGLHWFAFYRGY